MLGGRVAADRFCCGAAAFRMGPRLETGMSWMREEEEEEEEEGLFKANAVN
jgi:hypothetical protein